MAHKKGQGSVKNGRDSVSKRLGVKKFGSESVVAGKHHHPPTRDEVFAWQNVGLGRDYTIFALIDGQVRFDRAGRRVNVVPTGCSLRELIVPLQRHSSFSSELLERHEVRRIAHCGSKTVSGITSFYIAMKYTTYLLFGAPGAGKGTKVARLALIPRFFHCACGDVFRTIDTRTRLGRAFLEYSSRGELVPDDITVEL